MRSNPLLPLLSQAQRARVLAPDAPFLPERTRKVPKKCISDTVRHLTGSGCPFTKKMGLIVATRPHSATDSTPPPKRTREVRE